MKIKKIALFLVAIALCTAAVSAQTEADFVFDAATGTITKYTGWDTVITIPSAIGGKAVTAIDESGAFQNAGLTSVTIPDGVTVPMDAFRGNKLTTLTLGKGVNVESNAFPDNQLTSVTLGADCRFFKGTFKGMDFGYFAFFSYMCNSRKAGTYKIDAEWDRIWFALLYGFIRNSGDYEEVQKTAEGYTYAETPYGLAITDYSGGAGRLSIPDTLNGKPVKFIEGLGGYGSGLTGVRIPDSVVAIGDGAFSSASLSSGAFIGSGVTYIGNQAFFDTKLTSIIIPDSVTYIGYEAFAENNLTNVTIGANVELGRTAMGRNAFDEVYEKNGKEKGTYSRLSANSYEWTYTP